MARVLHLDDVSGAPQRSFATFDAEAADRGLRLGVAYRRRGMEGLRFRQEFLDHTRVDFNAELARVGFARAESARRQVNT